MNEAIHNDIVGSSPVETASIPSGRVRSIVLWVLSIALGAVFVISGAWKLYGPAQAGIRMVEVGVPSVYGLPFAILLGSIELFAGLMLLIPGYRRLGAGLAGAMLVAFVIYMGAQYGQLKGTECGCLPGRHRELGIWFFIEDGLMLAAAVAVFLMGRPLRDRPRWLLRPALALLAIVAIGAGSATLHPLLAREASLAVRVMDRNGRVAEMQLPQRSYTLLYFYNPSCLSCKEASEQLGRLKLAVPLIVLPDQSPELAYDYLTERGIKNALVSLDYQPLKERFGVKQAPSVYLVERGQARNVVLNFEGDSLEKTLREYRLLN